MRETAQKIIQAALKAVDPYQAILAHLTRAGNKLICDSESYLLTRYERIRVIGFGKACAPMARAIHAMLADRLTDGVVIVKYGHTEPDTARLNPIKLVEAGHPIPDDNSLRHTQAITSLLADSTDRDLILCLISGGGSALFEQPAPGLSLADIQALTAHLLAAGATIREINTLRKHLSAVKGGQLARLAQPATLISLILSDVGGDAPENIASGPTAPNPDTFAMALAVLDKYHLRNHVSPAILSHLQAGLAGRHSETPKPDDPIFNNVQNLIIANNHQAIKAAAQEARRQGLNAVHFNSFLEGEARDLGGKLADLTRTLTLDTALVKKPAALLFGGESTVTLRGNGLGGRNQELALAIARLISHAPNLLVACVATDGNDGPTNAAGAFVDGQTAPRALAAGLDPQVYLDNNDSYHFFQALDDLIITGPTNTNVNDLVLILVW